MLSPDPSPSDGSPATMTGTGPFRRADIARSVMSDGSDLPEYDESQKAPRPNVEGFTPMTSTGVEPTVSLRSTNTSVALPAREGGKRTIEFVLAAMSAPTKVSAFAVRVDLCD